MKIQSILITGPEAVNEATGNKFSDLQNGTENG